MKFKSRTLWIKTLAVWLAASGGAACSAAAGTYSQGQDEISLAAEIDHFLDSAVPELGGGCALLLIRDGKRVYQKSTGGFDLQKSILIASATKWLSGAVLLSLVDEKKLSLDDPASKFLSAFSGDKAGITIRQLLSHTSGLPMAHPALERRDIDLSKAVVAIAAAPLMSAPGEICMYGDASIQVAGRIAEIVSGRNWKALFAAKLSNPLEMAETFCEGSGATLNPHLAGGARSTVGDYANFLIMLLDGGRFRSRQILSRAAVAEMFRDQIRGGSLRFNPFEFYAQLHPGWRDVRYGICNWLEVVDGANGRALEASAPGIFGFYPWIDFERNMAGVFVCQSGMEKAFPVYLKLKMLIRKNIPVAPVSGEKRRPAAGRE